MFNENLKKYRKDSGLSQSELAEKLFVTRQCISKWEKGVTQPDLQTLIQISDLLNVSVDALLKDDNGSSRKNPTNNNAYLFIANILTAIFCSLAFIAIWRFAPQIIPAHWTHGAVDRYGSRDEILINIITAVEFLAVDIIVFFTLKRISDKRVIYISHGGIALCQIAYLVFIVVLYAEYISNVLSFITCLSADLITCVSVAMHPKINKQNYLLGVRTTETLNSETVWNKTNALACYLFTGCSLAIFIVNMTLIFKFSYLCFLAYLILIIVVIVYSKNIKD